jgi:uncharacterized protein YhbP (UPF0306 family)
MGLSIGLRVVDAEDSAVGSSILNVLASTRLLSMSMIRLGKPWINNAYFSFDNNLNLHILTPPSTNHATALEADSAVAIAVADSQQTGDAGKLGLQATGTCSLAEGEQLESALVEYRARFPATQSVLQSQKTIIESGMESRLYVISLDFVRLFDEKTFGNEVWIDADVIR